MKKVLIVFYMQIKKGICFKSLLIGFLLVVCSVSVAQELDVKPRGLTKIGERTLKKFGKIPFHINMDKVRELSKIPLSKPLDNDRLKIIFGYDVIAGKKARLTYNFIDDELLMGYYLFEIEHSNASIYLEDFNQIKKILKSKYGYPQQDDENWLDDYYLSNPDAKGIAVATGHLVYETAWEFKNGSITLKMNGDNYEIKIIVIYVVNEFYKKRDSLNLFDDQF